MDALKVLFVMFLVIVLGVSSIVGLIWWGSGIQANKINQRYETNYTTSDIFWFGEKIIIDNKVTLQK